MAKAHVAGAAIAVAAVAISGCAAARPGPRPPHGPSGVTFLTTRQVSTLRTYGLADTAFGLGLAGDICRAQPDSNVVLSPVSVASALGLALLGARGTTAAVMARVMHLPAVPAADLAIGLRDRSLLLASLQRPGVVFTESNRIWANPSLPPRPSYVAALRTAYQAKLMQVPLLSNPERARRAIDAAIAADTHGHIPQLLAPGSLTDIAWVLTNALYLKASWAHPFDPSQTVSAQFFIGNGKVTARYLRGSGFTMARYRGWTAASLPYRGDRLRMLALLPPAASGKRVSGNCALPGAAQVAALAGRLAASHQEAQIALPKINLSWNGSLSDPLTRLGMGLAFSSAADFTGLSRAACCIGLVQHAA